MDERAHDIDALREVAQKRYNFNAQTVLKQIGPLPIDATKNVTFQVVAASLPIQLVEPLEDNNFDEIEVDKDIDARL